jgi:hypothetical protein
MGRPGPKINVTGNKNNAMNEENKHTHRVSKNPTFACSPSLRR